MRARNRFESFNNCFKLRESRIPHASARFVAPRPGGADGRPGLYLKRKGITPADPNGPTLPDLLPGNPALNLLLKTILSKLLSGQPLLAGENRIAKEFKAVLAASFPFLAKIIDALDGDTPTPAAPAA